MNQPMGFVNKGEKTKVFNFLKVFQGLCLVIKIQRTKINTYIK
jgi:hypothetical protein